MKALILLLCISASAFGQRQTSEFQGSGDFHAVCNNDDVRSVVLSSNPPQYEIERCINGKWEKIVVAHNIPFCTGDCVDKLEARIAALEKKVAELEGWKANVRVCGNETPQGTKLFLCREDEVKK